MTNTVLAPPCLINGLLLVSASDTVESAILTLPVQTLHLLASEHAYLPPLAAQRRPDAAAPWC